MTNLSISRDTPSKSVMGGDAASRVLIIEDELTSRTILLRWLESAGYVADAIGRKAEPWQRLDACAALETLAGSRPSNRPRWA